MIGRVLKWLGLAIIVGAAYLAFGPVSIDPVAWTPPPAPAMTGKYAPNDALVRVRRLADGYGPGPEDIAIGPGGAIYTGYEDGRIVRFDKDGNQPKLIADTKGRPLGIAMAPDGGLYVADANMGLLKVSENGGVSVLATEADGVKFRFANEVAVGRDGTVYFTDSSSRWAFGKAIEDIFEHRPTGRLMAYDPTTKSVRVLIRKLQYANGVALSPDGSFVLVVETGWYRVRRYWLTGPKKGTADMFIENLPGFPDNITSDGKGTYWLALFTVRNPAADRLAGNPFLRKVVWRLPRILQPGPKRYGFAVALDANGKVVRTLQDPNGGFAPITSVVPSGNFLYLGSLEEHAIGRVELR